MWESRPRDTWCHGDLHPGNAMRRDLGNGQRGRCVLLDLAFVHPGHWVEDAVYIERQFWARPSCLARPSRCRRSAGGVGRAGWRRTGTTASWRRPVGC